MKTTGKDKADTFRVGVPVSQNYSFMREMTRRPRALAGGGELARA